MQPNAIGRNYSFTQKNRIKGRNRFSQVFASGIRWHTGFASFYARKHDEISHARLGISIAKKRVPKAVSRNKLKRAFKESFRHHQLILMGLEIVVVVKKGMKSEALNRQISQAWEKIAKKACHL